MKRNTNLLLIGIGALAGFLAVGFLQLPQEAQIPESEPQIIEIQSPDFQIAETYQSYPDWTLSIPQINFNQQMAEIHKQGKDLPVPDNQPGYYLPNSEHIFIVGHNNSVFNRLNEQPSEIEIWLNSTAQKYTLTYSQTLPVSEINMDSLFTYKGVVVMTCAGERINNTYTHRLILYYT